MQHVHFDVCERIDLALDGVTLHNLRLRYTNEISREKVDLQINSLRNAFSLQDDELVCDVMPDLEILEIERDGRQFLSNTGIEMDVHLKLNVRSLAGEILFGKVFVEGVGLEVKGDFDLRDYGYVDLDLNSSVGDLSMLSPVFTEDAIRENIDNLKKGHIFVKGEVRGRTRHHIPFAEVDFGARDIHFDFPGSAEAIRGLSFSGHFTTGEGSDLSESVLKIDSLRAVLPGGGVRGAIQISNFDAPEVTFFCDATADITGFDDIINIKGIENMKGLVSAKANLEGEFDFKSRKVLKESGTASLDLQNAAFRVIETGHEIENITGNIEKLDNLIQVNELTLAAGPSDLTISGNVQRLIQSLITGKAPVTADLALTSQHLLLNSIFAYDSLLANRVGDEVTNLKAKITLKKNFGSQPNSPFFSSGEIHIRDLSADFNYHSNIEALSGVITAESDTLNIKQLQARTEKSDLLLTASVSPFSGLFQPSENTDIKIKAQAAADTFDVQDMLAYNNRLFFFKALDDEVFAGFSAEINGTINTSALFGKKKLPDFQATAHNVSGKMSSFHLPFRNLTVNLERKADDLVFHSISGGIGDQFVNIEGALINVVPEMPNEDAELEVVAELKSDALHFNTFLPPPSDVENPDVKKFRFPAFNLSADIKKLQVNDSHIEVFRGTFTSPDSSMFALKQVADAYISPVFDVRAEIETDTIRFPELTIPHFELIIDGKNGEFDFRPDVRGMFDSHGQGNIHLDVSGPETRFHAEYEIIDFSLENLIRRFRGGNKLMSGIMDLHTDLQLTGATFEDMLESMTGTVTLNGDSLVIYNIDIDKLLAQFEKSQNFNLIDVSAVFLAGPAGAMVTKATDFAGLLVLDSGEQTIVPRLISKWRVQSGVARAKDVAFTTGKSRIALTGGLDLYNEQYLTLTAAVVDGKGCSLLSQTIDGKYDAPEFGDLNAVGKLLAPVINVFKVITRQDCEPFYTGSLPHPAE